MKPRESPSTPLERICQTLKCQPGDVLRLGRDGKKKR
ncbi:MAG: hypothetical protein DMF21_00715 [Verrucomicrobia bacterium]|nr:MAG: hypothetical protein DMF21_00715 [Verrucomicrobiota bacterium]